MAETVGDKTMRKIIALLAAAACLGGCAGTPVYSKPGSTRADFNHDTYECERDTRQAFLGEGIAATADAQDFSERCMIAKGWTIRSRQ